MLPKLTRVRTQLSRPSTSGWYCHSVLGGSETQIHCVTHIKYHISKTNIFSKKFRLVRYLIYRLLIVCYITPVNSKSIDRVEAEYQAIKDFTHILSIKKSKRLSCRPLLVVNLCKFICVLPKSIE